jgi:hypothetical protein
MPKQLPDASRVHFSIGKKSTCKNGRSFYGYKVRASSDAGHQLIRAVVIAPPMYMTTLSSSRLRPATPASFMATKPTTPKPIKRGCENAALRAAFREKRASHQANRR